MDIKMYQDVVLPTVTLLITAVGGFATIYVFFQNSQLKRAEWLYSLFEKFFYDEKYSEIRRIIDYAHEGEIDRLINGLASEKEHGLEEQLVNYLNFFEFIANLWLLKQVPLLEIKMMFEYYILKLEEHDFIMDYINKYGFEGVAKLVQEVKRG